MSKIYLIAGLIAAAACADTGKDDPDNFFPDASKGVDANTGRPDAFIVPDAHNFSCPHLNVPMSVIRGHSDEFLQDAQTTLFYSMWPDSIDDFVAVQLEHGGTFERDAIPTGTYPMSTEGYAFIRANFDLNTGAHDGIFYATSGDIVITTDSISIVNAHFAQYDDNGDHVPGCEFDVSQYILQP